MGLSGSKSLLLPLKDAHALLGEGQVKRLAEGWDRISIGHKIDQRTFQQALLGQFTTIPSALSNCIFNAFSGNASAARAEMDFQQFICGIAVLTRGSHEARARVLFRIFDTQRFGYLERARLGNFLTAVYEKGENSLESSSNIAHALDRLFYNTRRPGELEADEFVQRVRFNGNELTTRWIIMLADSCLEGPAEHVVVLDRYFSPLLDAPAVARRRRLGVSQVSDLERRFYHYIRAGGKVRKMYEADQWLAVVSPWVPVALCERVFEAMSEIGRGGWTVCDFVEALTMFVCGSAKEKIRLLLTVFDDDRDGRLNRAEVERMVLQLQAHHAYRAHQLGRSGAEAVSDFKCIGFEAQDTLSIVVDKICGSGEDGTAQIDGFPDMESFHRWASSHDGRTQLLFDLYLVACAEFGIRPAQPLMEWKIVFELYQYHQAQHPPTPAKFKYGAAETTWNLLPFDWWQPWKQFAQFHLSPQAQIASDRSRRPVSPGHIHNQTLMRRIGSNQLQPNLLCGEDYEVIPPSVWGALHSWYGGSPEIARSVVQLQNKELQLEVYPFCLRAALCDALGRPRPTEREIVISKTATVAQLQARICTTFRVEIDQSRLWNYLVPTRLRDQDVLPPSDTTVLAANLKENQLLVLEVAQPDGSWPRSQLQVDIEEANSPATSTPHGVNSNDARMSSSVGNGLVGLHNLGNTCFLNSSVQCLSHTPLLTQYFVTRAYLRDLNTTNILGHQGRLANAYASLVQSLWAGGRKKHLNPRSFKVVIAKLNAQFAGNDQHDAQELLSFLLSGLSEDLNRITDKPYIEQPDSDGRPDRELADIWWRNHLKRELSIIVALFTGQYKSCMTCAHCGYASARFEPFTFLQLPLPEESSRNITICFTPNDGSLSPIKCSVRISKSGKIRDVCLALVDTLGGKGQNMETQVSDDSADKDDGEASSSEDESDDGMVMELDMNNLAVAGIHSHYIIGLVPLDQDVSKVRENELLFIYEVNPLSRAQEADEDEEYTVGEIKSEEERVDEQEDDKEKDEEKEGRAVKERKEEQKTEEKERNDGNEEEEEELKEGRGGEEDMESKEAEAKDESGSLDIGGKVERGKLRVGPKPPRGQPRSMLPPPPPPLPRPPHLPQSRAPPLLALAFQGYAYGYNKRGSSSVLVSCVHRALDRVESYFLNPFRFYLFGTPLLLRIDKGQSNAVTGRQLYSEVARHVSRLLKEEARRRIDDLDSNPRGLAELSPPVPPTEDPSAALEVAANAQDAFAGEIPPWGFRLRVVTPDGAGTRSHWLTRSIGKLIPFHDGAVELEDGCNVAIDWHISTVKGWFDAAPIFRAHSSLRANRLQDDRTLTLQRCIEAFAEEEKLPDAYCSKCKEHRDASLKVEFWRLPPVLVVHLKRFQFTTYSRRKLHNLVKFPVDNLDMSAYVVQEQGTASVATNGKAEDGDGVAPTGVGSVGDEAGEDDDDDGLFDGALGAEDGRSEKDYELYAVVHHLGAMSAGHYVSSVKSRSTGKWVCFNDNILVDTNEKEVVSDSAYILFYVRKDMAEMNIEDVYPHVEGTGLSEQDVAKLLNSRRRDKCAVM